jgi:hypothetical protein
MRLVVVGSGGRRVAHKSLRSLLFAALLAMSMLAMVLTAALALSSCGRPGKDVVSRPTQAATSLPADLVTTVRLAARRIGTPGLTLHFVLIGGDTWNHGEQRSTDGMVVRGDALMPAALRLTTTALSPAEAGAFEAVTSDGRTYYVRPDGKGPWQKMSAAEWGGSFTPRRDITSYLAAASEIRNGGIGSQHGVLCRKIVMTLDYATLSRIDRDFAVSADLQSSLHATRQQASAAVRRSLATVTLWIGGDGLVRREDDRFRFAVGHDVYDSRESDVFSKFGEKIVPPITRPAPAGSPAKASQ